MCYKKPRGYYAQRRRALPEKIRGAVAEIGFVGAIPPVVEEPLGGGGAFSLVLRNHAVHGRISGGHGGRVFGERAAGIGATDSAPY